MKLLASESYNVAWFKLADFVARGEKERALSVHKLLMHSVTDKAISYQLEGDILLAFDDDAALDKFHVAANEYKKTGRLTQAISVYEHVSMFKEDEQILEALLDVYQILHDKQGVLNTFARLAKVCLQADNMGSIVNRFHRCLVEYDTSIQALLSARFVIALLLYDSQNKQVVSYIHQTIDLFQDVSQEESFFEFMSKVKALDKALYAKATEYLEKNF